MAALLKERRRHVGFFSQKKDGSLLNAKKEVTNRATALKKVERDPKCGFMIRSHDKKEVIRNVIKHAKKSHNMTITEKEVRDMMEDA